MERASPILIAVSVLLHALLGSGHRAVVICSGHEGGRAHGHHHHAYAGGAAIDSCDHLDHAGHAGHGHHHHHHDDRPCQAHADGGAGSEVALGDDGAGGEHHSCCCCCDDVELARFECAPAASPREVLVPPIALAGVMLDAGALRPSAASAWRGPPDGARADSAPSADRLRVVMTTRLLL
ncbi:MAG: hypothetical protein ACTS3F_00605 [Phycisphaerales bacterium]